ncbi:unnamed protein product [Malus baccata var. baccata]
MAGIHVSRYDHSPVHKAIVTRDYAGLRRILSDLPRLCKPAEIRSELVSLAEEEKADAIAAVIDRRDVPNRETPLHLAVKLGDQTAAEMLMVAGADVNLVNKDGWSALQEAICNREEAIAMIIVSHSRALSWAKWCRRLPRLVGTMRRMRDFYMEITFHFESSVIPFISRIAPSDTYKIWKRGANLRADMSLAGYDGLQIKRHDKSVLFLGEGSEDGKVPPGSLCMASHKDKEVVNALAGFSCQPTEEKVRQKVVAMSRTVMSRGRIDVTQAVLFPQMTWKRQKKTEMVGPWKAVAYDMRNVVVSMKSRRVPGAMTDGKLVSSCNENETESEEFKDILTEDEMRQLENALSSELSSENGDGSTEGGCDEHREIPIEDVSGDRNGENKQEKKGWFGGRRKGGDHRRGRDMKASSSASPDNENRHKDASKENECKKGLRPVLWLSPSFPLQTEELLPLLDILSNKIKAIRRLRELLTTKLPRGTFPVKVAIPVVPTVRLIVTFVKLEELPSTDEFATPPSSPTSSPTGRESPGSTRAPCQRPIQDPFAIPSEYRWVTKLKKGKSQSQSQSHQK